MKTEVKEFNVLCRLDEEGEPVYHKVIVTNKGAIKLSGHPDLKAEFYYHLMQIQQAATKSNASWRGVHYTVPTCLQFYFSLLKKKFAKYVERVNFYSAVEDDAEKRSEDYKDHNLTCLIKAADNERLTNYLEKFMETFSEKKRHNQGVCTYFTEEAFLKNNKRNMIRRMERFAINSLYRLPRFENYRVEPYVSFKPLLEDEQYRFSSKLSGRKYSGRFMKKGSISINLTLPNSWYSNIYKKGFAVINTEKYDSLVVLTMEQLDINKFLVEAITKVNSNTQNYKIQKFVVSRGYTGGMWEATRKNSVRVKTVAENKGQIKYEEEEKSVAC